MENKIRIRAVGVCKNNNKILLHRSELDDFWSLPGGGVNYNEKSHETLKREMLEELNAEIEVKDLLFTAENFFEWQNDKYHAIELFFEMNFINKSKNIYELTEFTGGDEFIKGKNVKLFFKWFDINEIKNENIKPVFLKDAILKNESHFFSNTTE